MSSQVEHRFPKRVPRFATGAVGGSNDALSHANMCRLYPTVYKLKIQLFPEAYGAYIISKSIGRLRLLAQPTQTDNVLAWKYIVADVGSKVIETYDPPLRDLLISMICRDDHLGPLGKSFAQRAGLVPQASRSSESWSDSQS